MIQKEKLVQFYISQYRDSAMALKKKNNDGKKTYEQRIGRLITEMQRTKTGKLTQPIWRNITDRSGIWRIMR